jgi:Fe-S-cluster containining protein
MIPRNCNFCGLCCTLIVKLSRKEVEAIESLGYNRKKFAETDDVGNLIIKRPEGWCYFLEQKNGVGCCKIYNSRPMPCSNFPGKKLCNLRDNIIFRDWNNKHPKVKLLWDNSPKKNDPLPKEEPEFPL